MFPWVPPRARMRGPRKGVHTPSEHQTQPKCALGLAKTGSFGPDRLFGLPLSLGLNWGCSNRARQRGRGACTMRGDLGQTTPFWPGQEQRCTHEMPWEISDVPTPTHMHPYVQCAVGLPTVTVHLACEARCAKHHGHPARGCPKGSPSLTCENALVL